MATMRQMMWLGGSSLELQSCPIPEPGPDEVRVRVHACGVCMTEVHQHEGLVPPSAPAPFVWGHEWCGTVEAFGPGVAGLAVGAPVSVSGRGGFSEYVVVPTSSLVPLPPDVPLDAGIFVEPLACCLASVEAALPTDGMTALVTGAGPMGQMVAQLARLFGARTIVTDLDPERLILAKELGAEATVNPTRESLADTVETLTGGSGVDVAWESAGHPAALESCLEAVRPGGTVVMVGVNSTEAHLALPLYRFHRRQLRLIGVYGSGGVETFHRAAALMPRLELTRMIAHRFGLADLEEAFSLARSGRQGKILIEPWR
ncbi:MAG: zinc-binding dehydrogenase [Chloroflexota bacterium]